MTSMSKGTDIVKVVKVFEWSKVDGQSNWYWQSILASQVKIWKLIQG